LIKEGWVITPDDLAIVISEAGFMRSDVIYYSILVGIYPGDSEFGRGRVCGTTVVIKI
jgi:hypothetical protein